ncbi:MAG: DUF6345 domain-containing protein [Clostridiaceae bacterium]
MKQKIFLTCSLAFFLIFSTSTNAFAVITTGGSGVSHYHAYGNCSHEDVVGIQAVANCLNELTRVGGYNIYQKFSYYDEHAWEADFLTASYNNVDDVDFAVFAGHGYVVGRHDGVYYNSLHFYTLNSNTNFHTSEGDDYSNADSQEIWWGLNGVTKWVATFSCNLLNSSGPKWTSIMGGVHQVLGYASTMYLDSRQTSYFASQIGYGTYSIKQGFFDSNAIYQPNTGSTPTVARVLAANISANDTLRSYSRKPAKIQDGTDTYNYWTISY